MEKASNKSILCVPVAVALVYKIADARSNWLRPDIRRVQHCILVGRRAQGIDYAGLWCVPGGKMESHELRGATERRGLYSARWEDACVRELREETSLRISPASLEELCAFEIDAVCGGSAVRLSVISGYAQLPADAGCARVVAPSEIDALEWWSLYDCWERAQELTQASARVILEFALRMRSEVRYPGPPEQCVFDALEARAVWKP